MRAVKRFESGVHDSCQFGILRRRMVRVSVRFCLWEELIKKGEGNFVITHL